MGTQGSFTRNMQLNTHHHPISQLTFIHVSSQHGA